MRGTKAPAVALALWVGLAGCGEDAALGPGAQMELAFQDLRPLDPTDGTLEVWVTTSAGDTLSVGRITAFDPDGETRFTFQLPVGSPRSVVVTVEPPVDADSGPSASKLMAGSVGSAGGALTIEGSITDGRPLEPDPGAHSLFTTSNNVELGYPSFEDAGLWLFTLTPTRNKHGTREVHVTPVRQSWTYAGWAVHRWGTADAVWVPYGKFRPDQQGLLSSRDDTGSGPWSGDEDYRNAGVEDVPGEEWSDDRVADLLGLTLPAGLRVPLDLDAVDPVTGQAEWTHVITIEPAFDEGEPPYSDRPFILRPYRNAIGEGGPGVPRLIELRERPPTARVRVVR